MSGRYTPACIVASIERFLSALDTSFPFASNKSDTPLPSCIAFAPLPVTVVGPIRDLIGKLDLDAELIAYLADSVFFALSDESHHARLFEGLSGEDRARQGRRIKADMMLLQANTKTAIVPLVQVAGELTDVRAGSPIPAEEGS